MSIYATARQSEADARSEVFSRLLDATEDCDDLIRSLKETVETSLKMATAAINAALTEMPNAQLVKSSRISWDARRAAVAEVHDAIDRLFGKPLAALVAERDYHEGD